MSTIAATYRGAGATRPGLPARDIDAAELRFLAAGRKVDVETFVEQLVDTGLYVATSDDGSSRNDEPAPERALGDMKKAALVAIATERGMDLEPLGKRPTNAAIVEAIEDDMRLAEEAAAALAAEAAASSSGESE
jgi:fructose-specific phosphotransferase system component IIB